MSNQFACAEYSKEVAICVTIRFVFVNCDIWNGFRNGVVGCLSLASFMFYIYPHASFRPPSLDQQNRCLSEPFELISENVLQDLEDKLKGVELHPQKDVDSQIKHYRSEPSL